MARWDRLVVGAYRLGERLLRPEPPRPRRVAGIMSVRNYSDSCSVFAKMRALCDVTIVLDDNSESPFPFRSECDDYMALTRRGLWNQTANQTLLLHRAFVLGCDWVVMMDDDIIFSHDFQTRQDVERVIDELEREEMDACYFRLRDLWDTPAQFRSDGVWGRKTFGVIRKNWFFYEAITVPDRRRRLHSGCYPRNLRSRKKLVRPYVAYHTGNLTIEDRERRVEKYRTEDPENTFQSDYTYMLDTHGLEVTQLPEADARTVGLAWRAPPRA